MRLFWFGFVGECLTSRNVTAASGVSKDTTNLFLSPGERAGERASLASQSVVNDSLSSAPANPSSEPRPQCSYRAVPLLTPLVAAAPAGLTAADFFAAAPCGLEELPSNASDTSIAPFISPKGPAPPPTGALAAAGVWDVPTS